MKKRSEAAQEKRNAILATARFKKAYEAAVAKRESKTCAHGHAVTPENTHISDLFRMGLWTCDPCNRISQARYHEGKDSGPKQPKANKAHKPRKQSPKPAPVETPAPVPVESAPVAPAPVVDRAAEITALMEKFGLSRKSAAQRFDRAAKKVKA